MKWMHLFVDEIYWLIFADWTDFGRNVEHQSKDESKLVHNNNWFIAFWRRIWITKNESIQDESVEYLNRSENHIRNQFGVYFFV